MLYKLNLKQAREGLKNKDFSSVELTRSCLDQISKTNDKLNAFITVMEDVAIKAAEEADSQLASQGQALRAKPLLGIPISLKDMFNAKGIKTTAGSNVLSDYISPYDSTVVRKLKEAGAIIIGKTNQDAWAHGSSGENSDFKATKNPWSLEHVPGGSSSGSSVAVAANMAFAAMGTDTGGSIRLPASFTSTVGLKPTYGRVSRYGVISMASSHDSIGHFAKNVEDSALLLQVTAGHDPMDGTSSRKEVPNYSDTLGNGLKGIRVGVDPEFHSEHIESETLSLLAKAYNTIKNLMESSDDFIPNISLPHSKAATAAYYIIQPSEVSSNLARYDGIRYGQNRNAFGEEAKRRIMLGTHALSSGYYDQYYNKASRIRSLLIQDYKKAFEKVDVTIAPVSPTPPWKLGEKVNDPLKMYLSDIFTVTANLAGLPAISIPIGFTKSGLPVGMQIIAPHFREELLFQLGHAYEQETQDEDWRKKELNL